MASCKRQRNQEEEDISNDFTDFIIEDVDLFAPFMPEHANEEGGSRSSSQVPTNNASEEKEIIPLLLTAPDLLDCPICFYPFCGVIYQCENGHLSCSSCRIKVKGKCPSCSLPITFNRCRAMEKLIESVKVECKNKNYGCKATMIYHKISEREDSCPNMACFCPVQSCGFADYYKSLYLHFSNDHASSAILFTYNNTVSFEVEKSKKHYAILQERNEGAIFFLKHNVRKIGRLFNVECLGPIALKSTFAYQLSVKCIDTCLSLDSVADVHAKLECRTPNKNYLTIPVASLPTDGRVSVRLCIKKVNQG